MELHFNDLSLAGQFSDPEAFYATLETFLKLRIKHEALRENFFCSRTLGMRPVHAGYNLQQLILKHPNRLFKQQVLNWLSKSGPFWDDNRAEVANDFFTFNTEDVTEQGLGEACRRQLLGREVASFSFDNHNFECTPLQVQHGWREPELDFGQIAIHNFWQLSDLAKIAQSLQPVPKNWLEMLQAAQQEFTNLIFAEEMITILRPHPFSRYVCQRAFELLTVLQRLVDESDEYGGLSDVGTALFEQHFNGKKAWFTDSSTDEKNHFKQELSFNDPCDPSQKIFCPWHGKIKTPQFRIHFQWPRPKNQQKIKIVYIGPKITKR